MTMVEWVAATQTSGPGPQPSNPVSSEYFVIALVAVVLGLVVWIFIRSSAKKSKR